MEALLCNSQAQSNLDWNSTTPAGSTSHSLWRTQVKGDGCGPSSTSIAPNITSCDPDRINYVDKPLGGETTPVLVFRATGGSTFLAAWYIPFGRALL